MTMDKESRVEPQVSWIKAALPKDRPHWAAQASLTSIASENSIRRMPKMPPFIALARWLDENVARIVRWVAFFGLAAVFMSWVASHIAPIFNYGWGAAVFAGLGAACLATLVFSGALVAWRYFNPKQAAASAQQYSGHHIFDLIQQIDPTLHAKCAAGQWKPCHDEMYKQLQRGAFVATGFLSPSIIKAVIPAAEWHVLRFPEVRAESVGPSGYNENRDFNRAQGGGLNYIDIMISRAPSRS